MTYESILREFLSLPAEMHWSSLVAAVIMTYLCAHPVVAFCRRGWYIKRSDILSSVDDDAKKLYLKTFLQWTEGDQPACDPAKQFSDLYKHRYGRYRLAWPMGLLLIVVFILSYLVADSALFRLHILPLCNSVPKPSACNANYVVLPDKAIAAIAGAYTWVVYTLARDAARYIMPPQTIVIAVLRLVVAAPLGYAVASLVTPALGIFLAFAIGAFPLDTIQLILQRVANKHLGLGMGATTDASGVNSEQVAKLDGVDLPTADRLQEGDITTIGQLAYCDPVQLSMRTNLAFDVITDLVNQALAYLYFGDQLEKLRPTGLRGAIEVRTFVSDLHKKDPEAEKAFQVVAKLLDQDPSTLRRAFKEIATDPYTVFLSNSWGRKLEALDEEQPA